MAFKVYYAACLWTPSSLDLPFRSFLYYEKQHNTLNKPKLLFDSVVCRYRLSLLSKNSSLVPRS